MADILFQLMLGSAPAAILVYLIVQGLKVYGLFDGEGWLTAPRAALTTALVLIVVALVSEFVPDAAPYIAATAPLVVGGLTAGLFYEIAGDPLLERVQAVIAALFGSK